MSTIIKKKNKNIPSDAEIIDVLDDEEQDVARTNQLTLLWSKELLQSAMLTNSLDDMKKAIFTCIRCQKSETKQEAVKQIRNKYIEYFSNFLKINISNEFYRSQIDCSNIDGQVDHKKIIVHGVDFLSDSQLQAKFNGIYSVKIQRINASNASIKFSDKQNIRNVLDLLEQKNKRDQMEQIDQEGNFKWKNLKIYSVVGFDRPLKYRFVAVNQQFEKETYSLQKFEETKARIQQSDLFITSNEEKLYYEENIKEFEDHRFNSKHRKNRSRIGIFERSRSRNQRSSVTNLNFFRKSSDIQNCGYFQNRNNRSNRFGHDRRCDRYQDRNSNGFGKVYQTQRNDFGRRRNYQNNFTPRNSDQGNFNENRTNMQNQRGKRFFNRNKNNLNRINQQINNYFEIDKKQLSKSNSSISYQIKEKNQYSQNPVQAAQSIVLNQNHDQTIQEENPSYFIPRNMNQSINLQDSNISLIIPQIEDNQEKENSSHSIGYIIEELQTLKKSHSDDKNSSLGKNSRRNSSQKRQRSISIKNQRSLGRSEKSIGKKEKQNYTRGGNFNNPRKSYQISNFNDRDHNPNQFRKRYNNSKIDYNQSHYNQYKHKDQTNQNSRSLGRYGDKNASGHNDRNEFSNRRNNRNFYNCNQEGNRNQGFNQEKLKTASNMDDIEY